MRSRRSTDSPPEEGNDAFTIPINRFSLPFPILCPAFSRREVLVCTPTAPEPVVVTDILRWQPRADIAALEISVKELLPNDMR